MSIGLQYRVVNKELSSDFLIGMSKKSIECLDDSQVNMIVSCLVFR